MPSKQDRPEKLARRSVQIIGFGLAIALLIIRITATIIGKDSGISEFFIGGLVGVGVSGSYDFVKLFKDK